MTPPERAHSLIDGNDLMTLATSDAAGNPWVSPVFYVPDDEYNLHWVSCKEARHSENIRAREAVAIVVYATEPNVDAVYLSGKAQELSADHEVNAGIEIMSRKPQPDHWKITDVGNVTDTGPWRIYRAVPATIEVRLMIEVDGKAVVTREPAEFRQIAS